VRLLPIPARRPRRAARMRGAALVVALLMLVILTLLAISGINTATTELAMAGNEQYRRNAAQAATAGIEQAITRLGAVPTSPGAAPTEVGPTLLPDSTTERYATATRFVGDELGLPQSSADKFVGLHFQVESNGTSARNASDLQTQGVMVVAASGSAGGGNFTRIGGGLE
jgi:type IV pilus assembly protein PilX